MKIEEAKLGLRVKMLIDFERVPKGSEGIIDEIYPDGMMIAWDIPAGILPKDYRVFPGKFRRPPWFYSAIVRIPFEKKQLEFLEVVKT